MVVTGISTKRMTEAGEKVPGALRGIAAITLIAVGAAALLAYTNDATRERIAANQVRALQKGIREVLPKGRYDNQPHEDIFSGRSPELLGTDEPVPVYRARLSGRPVAAVMSVIAPDGYVGAIRLLVSVDYSGRVIGVRAVEHVETPGLGDAIDADKSPWTLQFNGLRLGAPGAPPWLVRRDGGDLDQITGATVTSRAVVKAVQDALHYFEIHRDQIFDVPPPDAGRDQAR
jgi:electron transport complex protein RnfG